MRKDTSIPTTTANTNAPMFIELPKVAPNQQLFSLNTLTNQIVQLSPGLTTAALGPMERLLIVPAGITSQQLLQCLNHGQIHFNNIGQAAPSSNDVKTQPQQPLGMPTTTTAAPAVTMSQPPANQMQPHAQQTAAMQANKAKTIVQPQPVVVETPKAKKTKARKPKAESNKKSIVVDMKPTIVKTLDGQSKQVVAMKTAQVPMSSMAATLTTTVYKSVASQKLMTSKPIAQPKIIGNSPQTNQTIVMTTASQAVQANEALMMTAGPRVIHQAMIAVSTQPHQPLMKTSIIQSKNVTVTTTTSAAPATNATLPPLISVSSAPQMVSPQYVPRVQTIQLTPQKQQLLKNVQMQIQNLSGRLQNKQLLSSIRPDVSPNNPLCNKPLPTLTNINAMNDMEIYQALQRLFIEQQNILATGKIIPTLPAHGTHTFTANVPMASPISINASSVPAPVLNVSSAPPSLSTTVATVASTVPPSSNKPILTTMILTTTTTTTTTSPITARTEIKSLQTSSGGFKSQRSPGQIMHNGLAMKSPLPIVTSTPIEATNTTIIQSSALPSLPRSSPLPTIPTPPTPPPPPPPQPAPVPRSCL